MSMADKAKIRTVPHALIKSKDSYAYITKRIDRVFLKDSTVNLVALEDFCQLGLRSAQDKYKGSYERCGNIIKNTLIVPVLISTRLLIYCWKFRYAFKEFLFN